MKVHLIRTIWAHWGAYSGINQFVKYVDPERFSIKEQLVTDGDRNYARLNHAVRSLFRPTGMGWYKLNDLWAETAALPKVLTGGAQVLHYLDADHTALLLPQLKRFGKTGTRIVASYHQPPEILAEIIPNHVVQHVDRIVVVSPEQADYFSRIVGPERVRLILHGIDTEFFRPSAAPRREGPIRCLTVGFWLRDFDAIGRVADRLADRRDIEFHVVASQAAQLAGRPKVTVHSGISDDKLRQLYQDADILFLPLLKATANNALLEGIASGLPVVSTQLPSVQSYLDGAEAFLVPGNDPTGCIEAICALAEDPVTRARLARSSRSRAEALDWRRIAKQYEAAYTD